MNDIPADHMNEPGRRAEAPVATAERVPRHAAAAAAEATPSPIAADLAGSGPEEHPVPGRVHVSWRHALAAGLACFAVWLVLDAPSLLHSAQDAPLGTRRSVAIAVLRPVADVSDALGLGHVVSGTNRVIGHTGNTGSGVLQVEGVPAHRHRVATAPPRTGSPPARGDATPPLSTTPAPVSPAASIPTTPVTAPDGLAPLAVPTASAPLRLLVAGDSLGIDFGQPLVNDLAATDVVSAVLDGHIDTGLARPDYFNWQTELQRDIATYQPQAVVVFIGTNDPQNFMDGSTSLTYGTAAWNAAYAKRVGAFMQSAVDSGARVLWIGMPPMANAALNAQMENLNDIDQSQATAHRGVTYFASWPVLSNAQGQYSAFLPNASGSEVQVRALDGTHITQPGAQRLSQAAIAFMGHEWGLVL